MTRADDRRVSSLQSACGRGALLLIVAWASQVAQAAPPITAAALAPDSRQVIVGSQRGVEIRSWPDLEPRRTVASELAHVNDLTFSPDGRTLLVAGGAPAESGSVELYTWPDATLIRRVTHHEDLVYRAAWSPDGMRWATAGADGICNVVTVDTGERLVSYRGHSKAVLAIAYLPEGKTIVSAGLDETLQLWDGTTAVHLRTLDNHIGAVNDIAVRPTVSSEAPVIVASIGEDRTARLWQPGIGRLMRFARLPSPPRALVWSPDGQRLIIGCGDGHLRIVDWETAAIISDKRVLPGRIHALLIDPGQRRLLVAGDGNPVGAEL